jgi:hypothetical protein
MTGDDQRDGRDYSPDRHYADECSPACRAPSCSCGHCFYDHAIALTDNDRHSCTTGCGCTRFTDSGLSMQTRALMAAVTEAVGIPYGASAGDQAAYQKLLAERVMNLNVALNHLGDRGLADLAWSLRHLHGRLAELPVNYRTDYAEVLADMRSRREPGRGQA